MAANSAAHLERDRGLEYLEAGRYQHAEVYLRQAVSLEPNDPMVHYYLANALVHVGKHKEAIKEYQESYRLDPYGPVSGYCRKALETYRADVPEVATTPGAPAAAVVTTASSIVHDYPVTSKPITEAISKIRHEAEVEKERHKHFAESLSNAATKTGEMQANQIQENAKDDIDKIYNPPAAAIGRTVYNPLMFTPEMLKAKADEVRRNADEAATLARNRAEQRANSYKRWTEDHAYALDESAANLESHLRERNLPGTPRLDVTGTGLFVRNYQPATEPYPYPEPHASIARIHRVLIGPQIGDSANQAGLPEEGSSDRPGSIVHGTIVRQSSSSGDQLIH